MCTSSIFPQIKSDITIKTERLILRPLDMSYFDSVYNYATDLENTRYMVHMPKANANEVRDFLIYTQAEWVKERPSFYEFAIIFDSVHIGAVSVYFSDDFTSGEIGYIISKKYWGFGFAAESSKAVINMCYDKGLRNFTAHCDSENLASIRVLEKLGMQFVSSRSGRKNRSSAEIRVENSYKLDL